MIDYQRLSYSIEYYETYGFKRIEVPWTVSKAVSDITRPPEASDFTIQEKNKVLVASAEQGFLYLYLKGFLSLGKYQAISPCFRDESFDLTHTKYFMKNELIITDDVTLDSLYHVINICKSFYEYHLGCEIKILETGNNTFDLNANGVEVGSYGIRSCPYLTWIYATGVAEPRASMAKLLKRPT